MNIMNVLDAYTDYPFTEIGDTENQTAPIRRIKILSYDWKKYCTILVYFEDKDGDVRAVVSSCKSGYLYKRPVRLLKADAARDFFTHQELITQLPLTA
jgi:hypothetical protein